MIVRAASLLAFLGLFASAAADTPSQEDSDERSQLLVGVRAFRAERFDEALTAFRKVERRGGHEDLALYLGPTLFKLGRYQEARAILARAHAAASPDPVADYYLGLTYYRLGLTRLARSIFVGIAENTGPKLAGGSASFVAAIDAEPSSGNVSQWLERAELDPPDQGLDEAQEAFFRAPPGSPDAHRASLLLVRLALRAGRPVAALGRLGATTPLLPAAAVDADVAHGASAAGDANRARSLRDDARRHGTATGATVERMRTGSP